ncbi:hypothetical protein HanPSC8_Chr16g0709301 [Helianthus annuus]|nr:hypothetical protein HanPSC8_Chr16g0709301 [Helianthus annuus]
MNGGTVPVMSWLNMVIPMTVVAVHVISGHVHGLVDWFQWLREGGFDQNCLMFRRVVWSFWVVMGCEIT